MPQAATASDVFDPEALGRARAAAPGWSVDQLMAEWRAFILDQDLTPDTLEDDPEDHFVWFCGRWARTHDD